MMTDKNMNQYDELTAFLNTIRLWATDMSGTPVLKWISGETLLRGYSDFRLMKDQSSNPSSPASGYTGLFTLEDGKLYSIDSSGNVAAIGEGVLPHVVCMRLTPESGEPVTLEEHEGATAVYWSPFQGNSVRMYDGTRWKNLVATEQTLEITDDDQTCTTTNGSALLTGLTDSSHLIVGMKVSGTNIPSGATIASVDSETQVTMSANATGDGADIPVTFKMPADSKLDLFGTIESGDPVIRRPVKWTSLTTRATALALQDGVKVMSGETTALYLGTIKTSGTDGELDYLFGQKTILNQYHEHPRGVPHYEGQFISAMSVRPTDSNGCGYLEEVDEMPCRAFDASSDEYGALPLKAPEGWGGKVRVRTRTMVEDANSGNFMWGFAYRYGGSGEGLSVKASAAIDTVAAPGTADYLVFSDLSAEIDLSADDFDSLLAMIYRDADNASDTYASDAMLQGVEIYYLVDEDGG